jgi:hypothetical protein
MNSTMMSLFGVVVTALLFVLSYLFWNWYSKSVKKDDFLYGSNTDESEVDGEKEFDQAAIEKILSPGSTTDTLGGSTDRYDWHQNEKEVEIYIPVAASTTGKDVKCKIQSEKLFVSVAGEIIIDGKLFAPVQPDECNWQIGITYLFSSPAQNYHSFCRW